MFASVPRPALWLGFAGLIPFYLTAVAAWTAPPPWAAVAIALQLGYAGVILAFLGAVHWGLALGGYGGAEPSWGRLGLGVVPALVAWAVPVLPLVVALPVFIAAFGAMLTADFRAAANGTAPPWYPALRKPLTFFAVLALALSLARILAATQVAAPGAP